MFKSEKSGRQYGPGVKPVRVVLETRAVTYTNNVRKDGKLHVVVSQGHEIVREQIVGPDEI